MDLIIASNNKHKISEIKKILSGKFDRIISLSEAGIVHETLEDGTTFTENAVKKATEICKLSGMPALADDSGLCVEALHGEPGIYSARYSGAGADDKSNNALLLKNLAYNENRAAAFVSVVAVAYPDGEIISAQGEISGRITHAPRGENGFGYDPLFEVCGTSRTYAEMTDEEKNALSHRSIALKNLLKKLDSVSARQKIK